MIFFLNSHYLFLLLIFPLFFILKYFKILSPFRIYTNLIKWQENRVVRKRKSWLEFLYKFNLSLAILALIFAIAEPSIYKTKKVYSERGQAIMFLLDVSPSMAVKDMDGKSRFSVAKTIIKDFLSNMEGGYAGLSIFAKKAALIMVPTIDFSTFLSRLDSLELADMQDGTNINSALALSISNMKESLKFANLVLITDGENNSERLVEKPILQVLSLKVAKLNIIKLGREGYANIEYFDRERQKEYSGTYYTKTDDKALKALASSLDGEFIPIESLNDAHNIINLLNLHSQNESVPYIETQRWDLSFYFIFFAMVMAIVSWNIRRVFMGMR